MFYSEVLKLIRYLEKFVYHGDKLNIKTLLEISFFLVFLHAHREEAARGKRMAVTAQQLRPLADSERGSLRIFCGRLENQTENFLQAFSEI